MSHGVGSLLVFSCCVLCATLDRNVQAVLYASVVVYRSQCGVARTVALGYNQSGLPGNTYLVLMNYRVKRVTLLVYLDVVRL